MVGKDSHPPAAAAAKDKQAAGERIGIEFLAAELRERVDTLSSVDGVYRNQNAQLRRDLDQDACSHSSRLSVARYEAGTFFNWIRSLPRRPSSSIMHSGSDGACGVISSTNAGSTGFGEASSMRRFRSSQAPCNSRAVRFSPSFRATATAADQSSAGMRAFPLRFCLHSPKRTLASSRLTLGVLPRGMLFLLAGDSDGRTTLTVIRG